MDISGLSKASVLAVLYNRARAQGMGLLHYDPTPMTEAEAQKLLGEGDDHAQMFGKGFMDSLRRRELYFDYLKGRVMKIDLAGDEVDTRLYNRDNGPNAAEDAVAALR